MCEEKNIASGQVFISYFFIQNISKHEANQYTFTFLHALPTKNIL